MSDSGKSLKTNPTVLIVDDEEIVTQSLGSFPELETDYEVVTFQSPMEALYRPAEETVLQLDNGDRLIIFTDGLTEIKNDAGEIVGNGTVVDRVEESRYLLLAEALKLLADDAARYIDSAGQDDITLFGIEAE